MMAYRREGERGREGRTKNEEEKKKPHTSAGHRRKQDGKKQHPAKLRGGLFIGPL